MKQGDDLFEEFCLDSEFYAKVRELQADILLKHVNYHKEKYYERLTLKRDKEDRRLRDLRRQLRLLLVRE